MVGIKSWAQHILPSHLCPPGGFLPSSFQGHMQQSPKYTNTQKLNGRYQELVPTHSTVSLVPTWWIFTLSGYFLPQS